MVLDKKMVVWKEFVFDENFFCVWKEKKKILICEIFIIIFKVFMILFRNGYIVWLLMCVLFWGGVLVGGDGDCDVFICYVMNSSCGN